MPLESLGVRADSKGNLVILAFGWEEDFEAYDNIHLFVFSPRGRFRNFRLPNLPEQKVPWAFCDGETLYYTPLHSYTFEPELEPPEGTHLHRRYDIDDLLR